MTRSNTDRTQRPLPPSAGFTTAQRVLLGVAVLTAFGAGLGMGSTPWWERNHATLEGNLAEERKGPAGSAGLERGAERNGEQQARARGASLEAARGLGYLLVPGVTVEILDDYKQRFYHSNEALDTLTVETTESFDGTEFTDTNEFVASFDITTVGTRFSNEFFVGGRTGRGWGVIEKWQRHPRLGGPISSSGTSSPAPIGAPMAPTTLQQSFVAGTYVPPGSRTGVRELSRDEVIVATPDTPVPDAIGVDPEGRFLLVVTEGGDLHQVDLTAAEPALELIFTAAEVPPLAFVCSLAVAQHSSLGRLWFVYAEPCGANDDAVLFDYNNDGVIDDFVIDDSPAIAIDYMDGPVLAWY